MQTLKTPLEIEIGIWCMDNCPTIKLESDNKWLTVYYEDLLIFPYKTLEFICSRIGVDFTDLLKSSMELRKPSETDFENDLVNDPIEQLSKWQDSVEKDQLKNIDKIFTYFDLRIYTTKSPFPSHYKN